MVDVSPDGRVVYVDEQRVDDEVGEEEVDQCAGESVVPVQHFRWPVLREASKHERDAYSQP